MGWNEKHVAFMKSCPVVFLGSVSGDGYPCIKAMLHPRRTEGYETIYFSTNTSSLRVAQFKENPKACIYFCNTLRFEGLLLEGQVEVLHDPALKEALWKEGDTQYYPGGVSDPDYCVLKFTANGKAPRTYGL